MISTQTSKGKAYLYNIYWPLLRQRSRYIHQLSRRQHLSPGGGLDSVEGCVGLGGLPEVDPRQVPPQLRHVPVLHHQPDLLTPHRPQRCSAPDMEAMFDHAMYGGCRGCPGEVHHAAADGDRGAAAARVEAGHGGGAR